MASDDAAGLSGSGEDVGHRPPRSLRRPGERDSDADPSARPDRPARSSPVEAPSRRTPRRPGESATSCRRAPACVRSPSVATTRRVEWWGGCRRWRVETRVPPDRRSIDREGGLAAVHRGHGPCRVCRACRRWPGVRRSASCRRIRTSLVAVHRTALETRCSPKRPDLPRSRPTLRTEGPIGIGISPHKTGEPVHDGRTRPDSRSLPGLELEWSNDPAGRLGIEGFPGPSIPRIRTGRGRFTWSGNHSLTLLRTAVRVTSSNAAGCILPTTCCGGNPKTTTFGPSFEEPGFFGTLEGYRPPGICPARHLVVDERSPTDAPQHVVDRGSTAVDCPVRAFRNPNEVRTLDA
jgi:hypothetical protein